MRSRPWWVQHLIGVFSLWRRLRGLFHEGTNPIYGGPILMISSLPKGPTSSKQYLGSYESEQNTNIKLTALPKWHDIRRKGILVYATVAWMNSDNLMLSEISQHRKSKYGMNLLKVHRFISQKEGPLAETARVYHPRNSVSSCSKMSKLHSQRHLFRFSF